MEQWRKDARHEPIIVDLEVLVPKDHLLRKIEKVMDYGWLYERLDPYYCHDNGRPGTDPVVLIKMVLIQHLFGIPSLRQTYREIQVNVAYRWFLGYGLLDNIPHFATVSYAFCKGRASARRSWAKEFMHSAKRPLSVSLRMQKRNTQCVIHTTEAWPQSHDGSGLNMLP